MGGGAHVEIQRAKRTATLGAVRDLVRRLNAACTGAIGLNFYSGLGAAEEDTNVNYLVPVDAKQPGTSAFWTWRQPRWAEIAGRRTGSREVHRLRRGSKRTKPRVMTCLWREICLNRDPKLLQGHAHRLDSASVGLNGL
jgi:hypothetical protein